MANRDVMSWSTTAATNSSADANINWAEGMAPSAVNDSARAMMAAVAKWRDDIGGAKITLAGGTTAYTATTNQTIDTLVDGLQIGFIANATNTGACTLNVNSLGAKDLQVVDGEALPAGSLVANAMYLATYDSGKDAFLLMGYFGHQTEPPGVIKAYGGSSAPTGYLLCDGTAYSRTTYAALFAIIGTDYGTGDGSTTFNVPNLVGRVPAGVDASSTRLDSFTSLGSTIGSKSASISQANLPSGVSLSGSISGTATGTFSGTISGSATGPLSDHTHGFTADIGSGTSNAGQSGGGGPNVYQASVSATGTNSAATVTINSWGSASVSGTPTISSWGSASVSVSLGGSGTALAIVQPTIAVNYIIKT